MSNPYLDEPSQEPKKHENDANDQDFYGGPSQLTYRRTQPQEKKRHGALGAVIAILVVFILSAVAIFGVSMAFSVRSLMEDVNGATSYIERLQDAVLKLDADEISWSSKNISDSIASAQQEIQTWPWEVASKLPVLSEDVLVARQLLNVAGQLTNEALTPMATNYKALSDSLGSGTNALSLQRISANIDALFALGRTVADAGVVIKDCRAAADNIGTSHIAELNEAVVKLQTLLAQAESVYVGLEEWIAPLQQLIGGSS